MDDELKMLERPRDVMWHEKKLPFIFLPYHIFANWTNISTIVKENRAKSNRNAPSAVQLEEYVRIVHRNLHNISWGLNGLDKLCFISLAQKDT